MTKQNKKLNLIIILIVVFIDLLGVGLVIPILPELFGNSPVFAKLDHNLLKVLYGVVISAYPIAQLFGSPIFGYLSDYFGRKKILLLSVLGTSISYLLFAYALSINNIILMIIARLLDGFTGGNIFISQSIIIDMAEEKDRVKQLGLINISLGLGLVLGPLLGGLLADVQIYNLQGFILPYIFAFIISMINLCFAIFFLTNTNNHQVGKVKKKLNTFSSFDKIHKAFLIKNLKLLFIISYLYSIAFSFFTNFFPQYLNIEFNFDSKMIGFVSAYIGIWLAIGVIFLLPYLNKRYTHTKNLYLSLFTTGVFLLISLIPSNSAWLLLILPVIALGLSVISTNLISIISDHVQNQNQGEILGINQSVQAFGTTAPFIGGFLSSIWLPFPIFAAAVLLFVSFWIVYYKFKIIV